MPAPKDPEKRRLWKLRMSNSRKRLFASGELIHPRGMLGKKHTEEKKQQISNTLKTNPESRAFRTPKFYKKLSKALMGHIVSDETKKKLSDHGKLKIGSKNPAYINGRSQNHSYYRMKRKNLELESLGSHTRLEWEDMKKRYNYMCVCCKRFEPEIKLSEDHIVPLSKGGDDFITNIQPLCHSCNSRKNTKTIRYV
jgi:5-methylcytosine-specific restriction endonuclease McrA